MVVAGKELKLGENGWHRVCRPAWTSEKSTGLFDSHKHKQDRHLRLNFYVKSRGLYRLPEKKMSTKYRMGGSV